MFDRNETIRKAARDEMLKYFQLIGQATFGDLDIYIPGSSNDPSCNDYGKFDSSLCIPNTVFKHSEPSYQTIRNMRHHKHCMTEKGIIASFLNRNDDLTFTATELVDLNTKKAMKDEANNFVDNKTQLDRLSYTLPYDMYQNANLCPENVRLNEQNYCISSATLSQRLN